MRLKVELNFGMSACLTTCSESPFKSLRLVYTFFLPKVFWLFTSARYPQNVIYKSTHLKVTNEIPHYSNKNLDLHFLVLNRRLSLQEFPVHDCHFKLLLGHVRKGIL